METKPANSLSVEDKKILMDNAVKILTKPSNDERVKFVTTSLLEDDRSAPCDKTV